MNFNLIAKIHNECFFEKKDESYFENINNIYNIYMIENYAYLILIDSIDAYEIFEIAVLKNERNKGNALRLINMLPKDKDIFLEVKSKNKMALNLYLKSGFKRISIRKNYYKDDDAIIMKKEGALL